MTIGVVGPEAFFEVKYLAHAKQMQAMDLIPEVAGPSRASSAGSRAGSCAPTGRMTPRRSWSRSARCWGRSRRRSTSCATRGSDRRAGLVFRPFPLEDVRGALGGAQRVVVLEKALAVGIGGIVSANVRTALWHQLHGYTVIAGLGGRSITKVAAAAVRGGGARRAEAAQLPRPEERDRRARAGPGARGPRLGPRGEHPPGHRRRRRRAALGASRDMAKQEVGSTRPDLRGRQPAARSRGALGPGADGALQHPHLGPPRLPGVAARRSVRATPWTRRCAPPTAT